MLSLIIPTYNEQENIGTLIDLLTVLLTKNNITYELIVVDGNSNDKTQDIVNQRAKQNNQLKLLAQPKKAGLSQAVLAGFQAAQYSFLAVMDADLSHKPQDLIQLYQAITSPLPNNTHPDLVIGSRYTRGGKIKNWPLKRRIISKGATLLAKPFTKAKDPLSGFFIIRKECLSNCQLNSQGFKICLELLINSKVKHIKEIPITFEDRAKGKSKANIKEVFFYLSNLYKYATHSLK